MKIRRVASIIMSAIILTSMGMPAIGAFAATKDQKGIQAQTSEEIIPSFADFRAGDHDFSDAKGQSSLFGPLQASGNPQVTTDSLVAGKVANFDGSSAYQADISANNFKGLEGAKSFEVYFKNNALKTDGSKNTIFGVQKTGKDNSQGFALQMHNDVLDFYTNYSNSEGTQKTPTSGNGNRVRLNTIQWYHAVGVFNPQAKNPNDQVVLYIDGKKIDSGSLADLSPEELSQAGPHILKIGADFDETGKVNSKTHFNGNIQIARIYNQALTDTQVKQLSDAAHRHEYAKPDTVKAFESKLIGASDVVAGQNYDLNVHTREIGVTKANVDQIEYNVKYDQEKVEYVEDKLEQNTQIIKGNATITNGDPGVLHIVINKLPGTANFDDYSQTRQAALKFKAKKTGNSSDSTAEFRIEDVRGLIGGHPINNFGMNTGDVQKVTIHARNAKDLNGDGIIGVGDLALATSDNQQQIADESVIRPYKHVLVLTTGGGSNPWDKTGMFYAAGNSKDSVAIPSWTKDPELLKNRNNPKALALFNDQFALSTLASSETPAGYAANYLAMIHGIGYNDMDPEYRYDYTKLGQMYFPSFGSSNPKYPSIFKILQQNNHLQSATVFSEWKPLLDGVIEPDAPVDRQQVTIGQAFDKVAEFIKKDEKFNNSALTYLQSEELNAVTNNSGWFNDAYWQAYANFDNHFTEIMDALEQSGHIHDTLVIANSDHGGSQVDHGKINEAPDLNTYMALGGETIKSGFVHSADGNAPTKENLKFGRSSDLSRLILHALGQDDGNGLNGNPFKSSFLNQAELKDQKSRNVEGLTLSTNPSDLTLELDTSKVTTKNNILAADVRIDLNGLNIDDSSISTPEGVTVLRNKLDEKGMLNLTLRFSKAATYGELAKIKFKTANQTDSQAKLAEAMLGTSTGAEILPDLTSFRRADSLNPSTPGTPGENTGGDDGSGSDTTPDKDSQSGESEDNVSENKPKPGGNPGGPNSNNNNLGTGGGSESSHNGSGSSDSNVNHSDNTNSTKPDSTSNSQSGSGSASNFKPGKTPVEDVSGSTTMISEMKGHIFYSIKKIGLYRSTHFTKKNRLRWFKITKQQYWPKFTFVKRVHSKYGYRFKVKDANKHSKTYGKIGYITASKRYVTPSEYMKKPKRVTIINRKGLTAYRDTAKKHKAKHYRKNKVLKLKSLTTHKGKILLKLTNGTYITADKHVIKAVK